MKEKISLEYLIPLSKNLFEIPRSFRPDMRVPARVFATQELLKDILEDRSLWQLINVATLPGIQKYALAMPDIHEGYGFPIGGVAATAIDEGGVISPGGIGYDINCGVRLLTLNISVKEIKPYLEKLATELFHQIPSGVGRGGKLTLTNQEMNKVLQKGASYMLERGYGTEGDLEYCEEGGCLPFAQPDLVSVMAKDRGRDQLGTLGSGNHFLEIQHIEKIFDAKTAQTFGLEQDHVAIMIHCGSRGLGHQTCTDFVKVMMPQLHKWNIQLPDPELVCAPFNSQEGQDYFGAMAASANFAWANRHMIGQWVRQTCTKVIGNSVVVRTMYDLSHNMGKRETHMIDGKNKQVIVHRKGATRSFGPGRIEIPSAYRSVGQPVLIPGTMGTASYVLSGTEKAMEIDFGSSCHGAGRRMSRVKAKKTVRGSTLRSTLEQQGIIVRCESDPGLAEEAPVAYKDIEEVVSIVDESHLAHKVVRLKPLAVIKGG